MEKTGIRERKTMRGLAGFLGIVALLVAGAAFSAEEAEAPKEERFAIAAEGRNASAQITHLTGRAPYYHVYDIKGNFIEVIGNIYLKEEYDIGPHMAALLGDKQVTVLVGGMAGPKMQDVLDNKDIRFVHRKGVVQDIVNELRAE
jgi:predicted Fe-Mo cluster-binding NifX family protein